MIQSLIMVGLVKNFFHLINSSEMFLALSRVRDIIFGNKKSNNELTISQRNISLAYVTGIFSMFLLIMPVRVLLMQQTLSNAQISTLTGIIFFSIVFLELPTGAFADLVGKKITIQLSYVINAVAMLGYIWASSFWQFALVVSLQGLSSSLKSGANSALIFDSLAEDGRASEFRKVNSKLMAVVQFSMVIATFTGGWLGSTNLKWPFIGYAILLLVSAGFGSLVKEPKIDTVKFTFKNYIKQTVDGTKHLFIHKRLIRLVLLYMLVGGVGWTFQRLLRDIILIDVGFAPLAISLIGGLSRLLNILFLVKLANSIRGNKLGLDILFLPFLMVFSYLSGFWLNQVISVPIVTGIMMIGTGRFLLLNPYLQHEIESKYRVTAMSAAALLVSLFLTVSMFGMGFILDKVPMSQVMVGYGLFSLIFIVPLAFVVRNDFQKVI